MTKEKSIKINSTIIAIAFMILMAVGVQMSYAETTLKGRDYIRLGELKTLSGKLVQIGDEWGLKVGDITYEIHLGPGEYRDSKGFVLTNDKAATVKGFVYKKDISVATIETNGKSIVLRDGYGNPAWSGTNFALGDGR
jgi:hypothetical protein